ncbi:hypothetical protein SISNIDRAFT_210904 [Sistotremastrum niveocremeum HHB9708]|uniref:RING-type domain-containing protein n=1 Tax=Sistotremastrum niveocremeum HHB9708 TaxID=1314777 RepID=A0A164R1J6_9AGAM|nr:hypothetical protein SISNIDRAFT_210904 [Sistotremastrum niveocremeum HHB9708]
MLVLDSSATCDLCLRLYNGFDVAPHFLPCGHVSCGSCLARILVEPRGASCSWCRTGFATGDIRKLHCHVTATGAGLLGDEREAARARARAYELQLADTLKYSGSVTKTRKLVNNIVEWLEEQPRDDHLVLRTTVTLAAKYITDHQGKTKEAAVELSLRTRVVELEAKLETQRY